MQMFLSTRLSKCVRRIGADYNLQHYLALCCAECLEYHQFVDLIPLTPNPHTHEQYLVASTLLVKHCVAGIPVEIHLGVVRIPNNL